MDGIKISIRQSVDTAHPSAERGRRVTLQAVTLEPAQPADHAFLLEVYACTCREEMALAGWPADQRGLYLDMRYEAQRQSRSNQFPAAECWVIRRDDVTAGSMIVSRSDREILLLDLSLLPKHRNKNVGALVLASLMEEASQSGKAVRLRVESGNWAREWFQRLGFGIVGEENEQTEMLWRPASHD